MHEYAIHVYRYSLSLALHLDLDIQLFHYLLYFLNSLVGTQ